MAPLLGLNAPDASCQQRAPDGPPLVAFARIADLLSVSAAARALSLQKSSVSRSLIRLEREVGAALVDRSTRHLRLTDAGVALRPHALRIRADVDEAATALDGLAGVARDTLRVSLPFTVAVALVSPKRAFGTARRTGLDP